MKYDYIIVGQGIAGSMLSYALLKRNKKILVIDKPFNCTSLAIGGGMYSPIIFKRFTKAWMVDKLIPALKKTYTELEELLQAKFLYQKDILRIFASEQEKILWQRKCMEEAYWPYLEDEIIEDYSQLIKAPYGYGRVKNVGSLNGFIFLTKFRNYLKEKEALLETVFTYNDLHLDNENIKWKNSSAEKIIFCEGYSALLNNPFLKNLPFVLAKGELIRAHPQPFPKGREKIQMQIPGDFIISSGVTIGPLGNGEFIVGSTYSWNDLDPKPTEKGKQELLTKLSKVLLTKVEVLDQFAGIRPTVKDRRPLFGMHPQYPQLGIFNGMGTKGVMLAPYFAEHFANHLENQADLLPEVYAFRDVKEDKKV